VVFSFILDAFKNFNPKDIIEILQNSSFKFDQNKEIGSVLHLIGSVSEHGKFGITCIHNSMKESKELFENVVNLFKFEARKASTE
jgi:hypothetical protein